jgi:hypothetical protein
MTSSQGLPAPCRRVDGARRRVVALRRQRPSKPAAFPRLHIAKLHAKRPHGRRGKSHDDIASPAIDDSVSDVHSRSEAARHPGTSLLTSHQTASPSG